MARGITNEDIADAAQAYRMRSLTRDELQALHDDHAVIPCVSSQAIAVAAQRFMADIYMASIRL